MILVFAQLQCKAGQGGTERCPSAMLLGIPLRCRRWTTSEAEISVSTARTVKKICSNLQDTKFPSAAVLIPTQLPTVLVVAYCYDSTDCLFSCRGKYFRLTPDSPTWSIGKLPSLHCAVKCHVHGCTGGLSSLWCSSNRGLYSRPMHPNVRNTRYTLFSNGWKCKKTPLCFNCKSQSP